MLIHPDDIESPRFGNWADDFNTYEDACRYYGCDTPAQIDCEIEMDRQEACVIEQDEIEARGGPNPAYFAYAGYRVHLDYPF